MPRVLKDLMINEVSSVDRGAGRGVKVLLMKRDGANPGDTEMTDQELQALIAKSAETAAATATANVTKVFEVELSKRDAQIAILKMSPTHKAFYDGLKDEDAKKAFSAMDDKGKDAECAKSMNKADAVTVEDLAKRDVVVKGLLDQNETLKKRVDAMDMEKAQVSFKKQAADCGATGEGDGELMRKAYSGDVEAQAKWTGRLVEVNKALTEQVRVGKLFDNFGTSHAPTGKAYDQLVAKGEELRQKDPNLTKEQAFAKAYEANPEIVAIHKRETAATAN